MDALPKQTITLGYGKANFSTTLATYAAMKVVAPFIRSSAITSGVRMGQMTNTRVGEKESHGALLSAPVAHDQGTVILLQSKWMRGAALVRDGGLFLRLRDGAPLYSIIAAVPTAAGNICGDSFQVFSGYADILNVDELKLLGVEVPRGYASRFMDPEELQECYRVIQVTPERRARPSITAIATPEGMQMREVAPTPIRRLIIRRKLV